MTEIVDTPNLQLFYNINPSYCVFGDDAVVTGIT
jgi:hypothetical protein